MTCENHLEIRECERRCKAISTCVFGGRDETQRRGECCPSFIPQVFLTLSLVLSKTLLLQRQNRQKTGSGPGKNILTSKGTQLVLIGSMVRPHVPFQAPASLPTHASPAQREGQGASNIVLRLSKGQEPGLPGVKHCIHLGVAVRSGPSDTLVPYP